MSGPRVLKKNDILFREGDPSDSMYVVKTGRIAITKAKGSHEIVLAELGPGDMLGEMAFFDGKPRSAGAKAATDAELIELPFKALQSQFKTFPEWLKAVVKAVNTHLRNANSKIKNLERVAEEEQTVFPPHTVTRLSAILSFVAKVYGEKQPDGTWQIPPGTLRKYTIQVFQQPTAKMQTAMEVFQSFNHMKTEDLGEGKQKITVKNPEFLLAFTEFYNDFLFKSEDKRTAIDEKELKALRALQHFARKATPAADGMVEINLTQAQNDSMRELGWIFYADDVNSLAEKKVTSEKLSKEGSLSLKFKPTEIDPLIENWELIHAFSKVRKD